MMPPAYVPPWVHQLRDGDVIRRGRSGPPRRVLSVTRSARHTYITLPILRLSWTKRPDTTYAAHELVRAGYRPLTILRDSP